MRPSFRALERSPFPLLRRLLHTAGSWRKWIPVAYPQGMGYLSRNDTEGGSRMNESTTATTPTIGLTVDEVAKALRVDEKTVRKLIKTEGLPARIVGRGYRIEEGALRKWLAEGSGNAAGSEDLPPA